MNAKRKDANVTAKENIGDALGLIETRGLIGMIEATNTAAKPTKL